MLFYDLIAALKTKLLLCIMKCYRCSAFQRNKRMRQRQRESGSGDILNKEKIQLQSMPKGLARQTCAKSLKHHSARLMRSKGSVGQRHFRNTISLNDEKCHSNRRYIFNLVSSCVRWPLVWLDILQLGPFILFFPCEERLASETHKPWDNYIKSLQAGYWALRGKRFQGTFSLHSNTLSNVLLSGCPCHFPLGGSPDSFKSCSNTLLTLVKFIRWVLRGLRDRVNITVDLRNRTCLECIALRSNFLFRHCKSVRYSCLPAQTRRRIYLKVLKAC